MTQPTSEWLVLIRPVTSNRPCAIHEPEAMEWLTVRVARLAESLEQSVRDFIVAGDQSLGDIEVQVERQSRELQRQATEKAVQAKADVRQLKNQRAIKVDHQSKN